MVGLSKKVLLLVLGWSFIFLGIIGLFLPFLQGILFTFIGLMILSRQSRVARNILNRLKMKYPGPFRTVTELGHRLNDRLHRWIYRRP